MVNLILKPLLEIENSLTKALSEFSLVLMRFRVYVSPQNIASFEGSFNNGGDAMLEQIENTLKELKSAPREIKAIAEMYDEKILMLDTYVQLAIRYAPDIVKKPD
ncbi:MAG: hypothetical protein ACTTH5_02780 [Wolinella sp.]